MKTIEEMIASGASWDEIKQRVEQIQGEQKAKEEKKVAAQAKAMQVNFYQFYISSSRKRQEKYDLLYKSAFNVTML